MKPSVISEAIRRQCIEVRRRGFSRVRCTNEAVYGYYCEEHGTPPQSVGDGSESRAETMACRAAQWRGSRLRHDG